MGTRKTTTPSEFSAAVNEEIRVLMTRRNLTQTKLEELSGVSQSVISKVLYKNESVLNTNQLEALSLALSDEPSEILRRAEIALNKKLSSQNNYALAAESDDQLDLDEGDMIP